MAALPFSGALSSCTDDSSFENGTPVTTLTKSLKPRDYWKSNKITPIDVTLFKEKGYGILDDAPGEPHLQMLQRVSPDYKATPFYRRSLIMFPHITDIHITDIESPVRALYGLVTVGEMSAYRSNSIYSGHVLNAMIETINYFQKENHMDFLLMTGDAIDNAEQIELQWFNTIMNGGSVKIDSGDNNDPVSGKNNDFTDQFEASGLKSLPWYSAIGNHDALYVGIHLVDSELAEKFTGSEILKTDIGEQVYAGTQNAEREFGDPDYAFQRIVKGDEVSLTYLSVKEGEQFFGTETLTTPADPRRIPFRTHSAFQEAIKDIQNYPIQEHEKSGYYFFRPNSSVPIEFIVLDTTASKSDYLEKDGTLNTGKQNSDGFLDQKQFNWLKERLDYLSTEGYAAVITHHHPTYGFDENSEVSTDQYRTLLKGYDHILMVVVGHGHRNNVSFYAGADGEHGFHELQTSGLLDFPEQCRLFELVYNGDGFLSIFSTMLNHHAVNNSMATLGRELSLAHLQCWSQERVDKALGNLEDRNIEIVVPLPSRIRVQFDQLTGFSEKIRSLSLDS